ncbi:MAG: hypothetical protein A2Y15_03965 [Clostridiales bacterium GWF2_36_10]|nr:MAG: hypothetical protein A2Y15_03965 [Clostridiales bacterium GWF2_36_10]HAN20339.1 hypothetical protein [Clostridiales bacterium]
METDNNEKRERNLFLTLGEIENAVCGKTTASTDKSNIVSSIFTDSREVNSNKNGLFAAIKGEHIDAHSFVDEVTANGCFSLVEDSNYFIDNTILVDSTKNSLLELASWYRKEKLSNTKIIAVTGSVGKTSTKDMVALAVGAGLKVNKTKGNKNSLIGLPLSIMETETDKDVAVLEVGISEPNEMTKLSKASQPNIAIITNIGYSHIEALGSRENICTEKLAVADYMPNDGMLILNGDEPLFKKKDKHPQKKIYCSIKNTESDCFSTNIKEFDGQTYFTSHIFGKSVSVTLNTLGLHNVSNALFALTAASLLGVDLIKATEALSKFEASGLRQKIYKKDGYTIIADCYNASPESMVAALSVLGEQKGKKIAVLGDMLELGSFAHMLHEKVGQSVLENRIDILITFGSLSKSIAIPVLGKIEVYSFEEDEYDKAADFLRSILTTGDYVLYKASNRMKLQKIIEKV